MTDIFNDFFLEDDDILATVLEESLRHYQEVEVPLQSINLDTVPKPNVYLDPVPGPSINSDPLPGSSKKVEGVSTVIDLCESPKKCQTVQSRLSHFFRKPDRDKICDNETNSDNQNQTSQNQEKQTDQIEFVDLNSSPEHIDSFSSLPAIFYKKPDADGFHLSSGSHYVYPSNFPVREYQMEIIKTALFHNTLVSLPTGLGKTFIAAVVMYNFYRWYPMGKVVFMAPTRPLVAQQIEACHSIMGIPRDVTFEMTGNIPPEQRYLAWKKYRVFFLTPQVLANDLSLGKCPSEMFKCIIVDEAHRATKDYAYVQVLKRLDEENRTVRIVGLSATPGTTVETVTEVIQNLSISRLEFRTDESPDVARYTNKKDIECIPVQLTNAILNVRSQFLVIYDKYSRRLKQYNALSGNVTNLAKFQILGAKQKFLASHVAREMPKPLVGCLINDFTICMSLAYALELLIIYGIKVFYLQSLEMSENHKCLLNDGDFQKMLHKINTELNCQDLTWSHPKLIELKKIVHNYFGNKNTESNSKIIIFCQYRLVVVEVFELLKTFGSSVKPVMFVGQSSKEKGGLPQKKQLEVMSRFKSGDFNVLIATSVAEEGLDIGEVDLIICLEANKSPIKFVQRLGRTGRKRSGKCITLLTEGKEQMKYKSSVASSKTLVMKMLKNKTILSKLAQEGPRLIPKHINPKCLMIHVKKTEKIMPEKKGKGKKNSETNNIMQYTEQNDAQNQVEDGLDVFQQNQDKPKRKSKKRKTVESEPCDTNEVAWPADDRDMDIIPTDYEDIVATANNEHGSVEVIDLDCFSEEEKAFDEWQRSCERTDCVAINELFFKLLNLFADCPTANGNGSGSRELFNHNKDELFNHNDDEFFNHNDGEFFNHNGGTSTACTGYVDIQEPARSRTTGAPCSGVDARQSPAIRCDEMAPRDVAAPVSMLPDGRRAYESDSDDLFENVRDHFGELPTDTSPVTAFCGRSLPRTGTAAVESVFAEDNDTQSSSEPQFFRAFGEKSYVQRDAAVVVAESGGRGQHTTRYNNNDDDTIVDDDVNFEDLFKSQRADRYIEKYNDEVMTGKRSHDDCDRGRMTDEDGGLAAGTRRSVDGPRMLEMAAVRQQSTGSEKTPVREDVLQDDDDGVISLDDSPEFFSLRMPTKRRGRNKGMVPVDGGSRSPPIVDLSTPPCSQARPVARNVNCDLLQQQPPPVHDLSTPPCSQARRDHRLPDNEDGNDRGGGLLDDDDDDMDFMFIDYCSDVPLSHKDNNRAPDDAALMEAQRTPSSAAVASSKRVRDDGNRRAADTVQSKSTTTVTATAVTTAAITATITAATTTTTTTTTATTRPQLYGSGSVPLNILKACNLFKPGISLKMSTAASKRPRPDVVEPPRMATVRGTAAWQPVDDMSPIHPPGRRQWPSRFSQSTPKVTVVKPPPKTATSAETFNLLTSSSDSDVFVHGDGDGTPTAHGRVVRKKRRRRRKPKKKLVFIDDEADVSHFNESSTAAASAAPNVTSSSSENDDEDEFDSSFIDDDVDKCGPSTSITKQYLRSVKSPANVRGVFKIPQLTRNHYNMDVYSQMVDRTERNSYEEDSFCVNDESELLNSSSSTSAQHTSEERPSKPRKRKRIVSPQSSDSDSPDQLNRNMMRKRFKSKMALDFS